MKSYNEDGDLIMYISFLYCGSCGGKYFLSASYETKRGHANVNSFDRESGTIDTMCHHCGEINKAQAKCVGHKSDHYEGSEYVELRDRQKLIRIAPSIKENDNLPVLQNPTEGFNRERVRV